MIFYPRPAWLAIYSPGLIEPHVTSHGFQNLTHAGRITLQIITPACAFIPPSGTARLNLSGLHSATTFRM